MRKNFKGIIYSKAQNMRRTLVAKYDHFLNNKVDVIVMPTTPMTATKFPPPNSNCTLKITRAIENDENTCPFDITGHPAVSVPCGLSSSGLPIGFQIVGRHFDEATVYRVAYALERELGDWKKK